MARPAEPVQAKVLKGTFRKDRHGNAPTPEKGAPECPDWLPKTAKRYWKEIAPQLETLGLIDKTDGAVFAIHCDTVGKFAEVTSRLQTLEDLIDETPHGLKIQSALFTIRSKLWDQILRSAKEFGLSPAARGNSALTVPSKPESKNDWEDI